MLQMVNTERILQYTALPPEAPLSSKMNLPEDWPTCGSIAFSDVSFAYSKEDAAVLQNVSFCTQAKEKVDYCNSIVKIE